MAGDDSIIKTCNTCAQDLPISAFYKNSNCSGGINPKCRVCVNKARKAQRDANPEKFKATRDAYYAKNSERILAKNAKSREKHHEKIKARKRDSYHKVKHDPEFKLKVKLRAEACKDEKRKYDREYRERRAEHLKIIKAAWIAENRDKIASIKKAYVARRRSQEKTGDPTRIIHEWEMSAKKVCHWCNVKCQDNYHVDHYVPLSKGGAHVVSNLVIACPKCNLKKNAKDPYEFAASVGRLF